MSLAPGTVVGKYVIQRKLAEGGMAEIFLASAQGAEGFEKPVVIKRIRSGLANDTSFVEMFIAEARLASRLSHPNLVHIFDFDRHEDTYYLAMEYIRGRSLLEAHNRALELSTPVPPVLVAQIGVEVARGLGYAHRLSDTGKPLNLVHRDVTPHNVLLSYDGAVKLTDFGIAKAGGRATAAGMLKGKFAYMAPEQARGDPVDARTDLFSLGITLWELLTGARLFDGDTDMAVLRAVQERPVLPPAELNPGVNAELSGVIVKALERAPASRYQTATELERGLLQYVLHHSQGPEDTDVGGFIRELFPVEAERAEAPVSAQPGSGVGRAGRDTVLHGEALAARPSTSASSMPPDMLVPEPAAGGKTLLSGASQASESRRHASYRTQPTGADSYVDDGPTLRRPVPVRARPAARPLSERLQPVLLALRTRLVKLKPPRAALVVGALALLSLVFAVVVSKPKEKSPSAPAEAKPLALDMGTPVPTPLPPPPAEPTSAARAVAPVAAAPVAPGTVQDEGVLELTLVPKGTVTIDGKEATPVQGTQRFTLKPGRHEVMASDSKTIVGWTVFVRPGLTVKKHYAFKKHK